jgi:hypothetical protein
LPTEQELKAIIDEVKEMDAKSNEDEKFENTPYA